MRPTRYPIALAAALVLIAMATLCAQDCLQNPTTVTIQGTPSSSLPGQSVMLNAYVSTSMDGPDPTGTIQLMDGTVDLGTYALKVGQMSTTVVFSQAGTHSIYASYSGDSMYCSAYQRYGQFVDRFVPTVSVTATAATAPVGQPVTFKAQVSAPTPAGVAGPTGTVEFYEGTTDLGGSPVSSTGAASLTLANLTGGNHLITAVFTGDINYYLVRSIPVGVTVTRAQTTTALTATLSSGQVQLIAAVSISPPGSGLPGGNVQFVDTTAKTVLGSGGLPAGAGSGATSLAASIFLNPSTLTAGHTIAATYLGDSNSDTSTSNSLTVPALASATGAPSPNFAAEELVSLFGSSLTTTTLVAGVVPLPTSLGGYGVTVVDSAGTSRAAGLILMSPTQINFMIPTGTAPGAALVTVSSPGVIPVQIAIVAVAPGIFSAGANGKGLAAAQIARVHPDGTQSLENVTSAPIVFGSDTLYLVLYATGVRGRSSLANVTCIINGLGLPVTYAGPQTQFPGLDQVDVLLPASLKGAGQVNVSLTVDGQTSNTVTLAFQ